MVYQIGAVGSPLTHWSTVFYPGKPYVDAGVYQNVIVGSREANRHMARLVMPGFCFFMAAVHKCRGPSVSARWFACM